MILENPEKAVSSYNRLGLQYNLVAEGIYRVRTAIDPFSREYERFIIAGLIAFDMRRMMGQGDKYATEGPGFGGRLRVKMRAVREAIGGLSQSSLHEIDLAANASGIEAAYGS
jgi:hypothetical protein